MTRHEALCSRYDRGSDVLYITIRPNTPAVSSEEDEPGLMWRYAVGDGQLIGVTVMDFAAYWSPRASELIASLSKRFHVSRHAAEVAIETAH